MQYVFCAIAFVFSFALASHITSQSLSGSDFNYDEATVEDQEKWLQKHATAIGSGIKRSLPNGGGAAPPMELVDTWTNVDQRKISFKIQIKGPAQIRSNVAEIERSFLEKACRQFVKMPLYAQYVTVTQTFYYEGGERAWRLKISGAICDRMLG